MPKITVQKDGTTVSEKRTVNFVAGTGITITPTDNPPNQPVDIQIDGHAKSHTHSGDGSGSVDHGALSGLGDDDHTQYRLESADHTHQSTGLQAGQLDHGLALTGLTDDDHTQYLKEEASGGLASEVPDHTHASGAEAGTVAHSALTGIGANDHHDQTHATAHQSGGADDLTAYFARLGAANAFTTGGHTMTAESAGVIPLVIKGAASQSANLQEWQDSTGAAGGYVWPTGDEISFRKYDFKPPNETGTSLMAFLNSAGNNRWSIFRGGDSEATYPNELVIYQAKTAAGGTVDKERLRLKDDGSVIVGDSTALLGFYGAAAVAKQTGVAVTAAAIHAALVNLGLIAA